MDSKAMLLLFLLIATILHFTPTASSLDHHEELKIKVNYVNATAAPLAKLPTPPRTMPKPPIYKPPPPPPPIHKPPHPPPPPGQNQEKNNHKKSLDAYGLLRTIRFFLKEKEPQSSVDDLITEQQDDNEKLVDDLGNDEIGDGFDENDNHENAPIVTDQLNCFRLCRKWCMPRPWRCMGVCTPCCDRCRCVPPLTLRNGGRCRKCSIDVAVYGKISKCP